MRLGDDNMAKAIGLAKTIIVEIETRGIRNRDCIIGVFHVPKLKVHFHVNKCIVGGANDNVVAIIQHERNVYQITFTKICASDATNFVQLREGNYLTKVLHSQLICLNVTGIIALQRMIRYMDLDRTSYPIGTLFYKACIEGKQYATKFCNNAKRLATKPLEIVHLGVCGPMKNTSIGREKYFATFVDDYLRKVCEQESTTPLNAS